MSRRMDVLSQNIFRLRRIDVLVQNIFRLWSSLVHIIYAPPPPPHIIYIYIYIDCNGQSCLRVAQLALKPSRQRVIPTQSQPPSHGLSFGVIFLVPFPSWPELMRETPPPYPPTSPTPLPPAPPPPPWPPPRPPSPPPPHLLLFQVSSFLPWIDG